MVTSFLFFFKHKNKMQYFGLVLLAGAVSEAPSDCVQVCDVLVSVSWACATMPGSGSGLSVQRCLTFTTGLVECLCFAGAVFGWASLVFVLKEEGYFSSLCVNGTGVNGTLVLGQCDVLTFTTLSNNKLENGWRMEINQSPVPSVFSNFCFCRLRRTGWTVLAYFYHCVFYEQLSDAAEWFPFWSVWYYSDSALRNVSPAP